LELDYVFLGYFRETITNFLAVHQENGFQVLQITILENQKNKEVNKFLRN